MSDSEDATTSHTLPTTSHTPPTAAGLVEQLAQRVGGRASVEAVFGEPIDRDGVTVIPVASLAYGFGGRNAAERDSRRRPEGGGGGTTRPIGYIQMTGGTAVFKPTRDPLRDLAVPLVALLSAAIGVRLGRALGPRRK